MARVCVYRQWAEGDVLQVSIDLDASSYPDALDEARNTALRAYAEALLVTLAAEADDPDTPEQ